MKQGKKILILYVLLGAIAVLLVCVLIGIPDLSRAPEVETGEEPEVTETPPAEKPVHRGSLYIIIDDVGNSMKDLAPFLSIDIPMTFAVLPERPYTVEAAKILHEAGKQVIIHQPMEPEGQEDPGKGALYSGMKQEEVYRILEKHLKENPYAVGMNNHMGSKASADREVMTAVLMFAKEKKLYYVDSYTTGSSVGKAVADSVKTNFTWRNSMFLDNDRNRESIMEALRAGLETAEKRGHAVMIGHVMSNELAAVLMEMYPELLEEGYTFKEISEIFTESVTDVGSGD